MRSITCPKLQNLQSNEFWSEDHLDGLDKLESCALDCLLSPRLGPGGHIHESLCEVGNRPWGVSGRELLPQAFSLSF